MRTLAIIFVILPKTERKIIMEIDKEILKKTSDCKKNFDCLKNDQHIFCKVEYCVNHEVHFVKCMDVDYCVFKMYFGQSFTCNCPTRKEIFNKYNI